MTGAYAWDRPWLPPPWWINHEANVFIMTLKHSQEYRDADTVRHLAGEIAAASRRRVRLMEVCGTHTMAIFRHGIRSLLPTHLSLLSGPGCPVCVTAQGEIDAFVTLARLPGVIVTTFGDLMRVPGSGSSLQQERSRGRDVRLVYSPLDALTIARENPDRKVVFLGVGFETTAPTVAAAIFSARQSGLTNFSVYSAHKTVPPALSALMDAGDARINGFLLPGHVSVIIGMEAYRPFFEAHQVPCVVGGFEPVDIMLAVRMLIEQIEKGAPALENAYSRAVSDSGNQKAQALMAAVLEPSDAVWRGIGPIAASGLAIADAYADFNAAKVHDIQIREAPEPKGCACGEILLGQIAPPECPLYKTRCSPTNPVGPCMVSTEGTCAAYFRYHNP
jgi:hydrogenase expression/formation protein HypD